MQQNRKNPAPNLRNGCDRRGTSNADNYAYIQDAPHHTADKGGAASYLLQGVERRHRQVSLHHELADLLTAHAPPVTHPSLSSCPCAMRWRSRGCRRAPRDSSGPCARVRVCQCAHACAGCCGRRRYAWRCSPAACCRRASTRQRRAPPFGPAGRGHVSTSIPS